MITSVEAARRIGCSRVTVIRLARSGQLPPAHKAPGRRGAYLFDPATVNQLAKQGLPPGWSTAWRKATTTAALLTAVALSLAGCRDSDPINGTPHPNAGDWTRPGTFMIAATLAAFVIYLAPYAWSRRRRRGRHRATG